MKKIILLFSIITLLTSCSKDYDDIANPINQTSEPVLVKKIIITDLTNNTVIKNTDFEYEGNKIVKSTDQEGYETMYAYTGDLISNIKVYHSNALELEYILAYENNNLTESKAINYLDNFGEKRLYTYNTNGTVDFIYYKGDITTQNIQSKTGTITIQNNEVSGIVIHDVVNSISRTVAYTYDNKKNPHKNVIGFNKLNVEIDRTGGSFKNPVSATNAYNSVGLAITDFNYTYNTTGYPTSSTEITWGVNHKSEYFY